MSDTSDDMEAMHRLYEAHMERNSGDKPASTKLPSNQTKEQQMALIAKSTGESFELAPTGNQQAVCAFVCDIGTHKSTYQGKELERHQVVVCWELAEKMTKGEYAGKPFMLSKFYTLSLNEKASLRHDLDAWRGIAFTPEELKGFDLEKIIGANCLLNIIESDRQDGSKGRKIASISPLIKGMPKLTTINTTPPAWIAEKRAQSIEALESFGETAQNNGTTPEDPTLPF